MEPKLLKRFGYKGQFVKYPSDWPRRMINTGKRRFATGCDLIVGMCACGERHSEETGWVIDSLDENNCRIESFVEWLTRFRNEKK
jgi:hypothetical protein